MKKLIKEPRDWSYVRCETCDGKSLLAYDVKAREFLAICEACKQFTHLDEVLKVVV